jgi:hypothetical protein
MSLHITDDPAADTLLTENPLALLIGMLLDQQVAMETAFSGPLKIQERIGAVDAATIAGYDPDALVAAFQQSPAVHRYPGSMAGRVQTLCRALEQDWGGDAAALWTEGDPDGPTVLKRLKALPASASRRPRSSSPCSASSTASPAPAGARPRAPTAKTAPTARWPTSSPESLAKVREFKKAAKAAAKSAKG